jgi:hypothetical protein
MSVFVMNTRFFEMDTKLCQRSRYRMSCLYLLVLVQVELNRFHQWYKPNFQAESDPTLIQRGYDKSWVSRSL